MAEPQPHMQARYQVELDATTKADRRPLYTVEMDGPIGDPSFYANSLLLPILRRLLGADLSLGAVSAVISFPGAPQQFGHRDSPFLFAEPGDALALPPYAITVLMPMIDANAETGSTRVWPGTHRVADLEAAQLGPSPSTCRSGPC